MSFNNAESYVHTLLRGVVMPGDVVVDATVGNGFDTLFLAERVAPAGLVLGFDIQEDSIRVTRGKTEQYASIVRLFTIGHEDMLASIPTEHYGHITAVMFNLGYRPGGDKQITTTAGKTVAGLQQAMQLLKLGGVITVVVYRHPEGMRELAAVRDLCSALPQTEFTVTESWFVNQQGMAPIVFAVCKHR